MYETIFGLVFITIGTVLILLGSRSHRRTGSGTGTDSGSVRADLERAGDAARGRSVAPKDELPELPGSDFRLERKIGSGGMGVVFEARQISLDRRVAVKVLAPSLVANATRRNQFEAEARIVAMLHHPNIVKVIGAGQSAGTCYYAMEIVDGERLDKHAFKNLRDIASAGLQAATALAYAHRCQVMHRDIKPSNLIIDDHVGRNLQPLC